MGLKLELFETIYDRIANSSELNRVCDFDSKERKQIARTVLKFFKAKCEDLYMMTEKFQV